ncbi:MAG: F420-nonreducing hydrogenase [Thermoprotei archaeon]|nr:MAG: F420-nonreducing hydrogenase [Thermoprotei archaeon]
MKRLAIISLMSDGGCHIAFLELHEELLHLLGQVELIHSYMLVDRREIPEHIDIALIEGGVRTTHDIELLKEARSKSKILVALGSCACFGGIPGLSNLYDLRASLDYVYRGTPTTTEGVIPHENVPSVIRVAPISRFVQVDLQIPGCPPEPEEIKEAIVSLIKGEVPSQPSKTVCDECELGPPKEKPRRLRKIYEPPEPDRCLLEQGYFCMGPVTRAGCGAKCPRIGVPCDGCRGPAPKALDQGISILDALVTLAYKNIENFSLKQHSAYFYRYTFASSVIEDLLRKKLRERR